VVSKKLEQLYGLLMGIVSIRMVDRLAPNYERLQTHRQ
jgi:hypothetical protein